MNIIEPTNPPTIVMYSVEPSCALNICIPAKHSTTKVPDSINEGPVETPGEKTRHLFNTAHTLIHDIQSFNNKSLKSKIKYPKIAVRKICY